MAPPRELTAAEEQAIQNANFSPEGEQAFRELAAQPEGVFALGGGPPLAAAAKESISKTIQEQRELKGRRFGLREAGLLILAAKSAQAAARVQAAKRKEEARKRQTTKSILSSRAARARPSPVLAPTLSAGVS